MAGSIIVSENVGVALNSFSFSLVIERTRQELERDSPGIIEEAYESHDVGCMPFIVLASLTSEDLHRFLLATERAYKMWRESNDEDFHGWEELILKIKSDDRL